MIKINRGSELEFLVLNNYYRKNAEEFKQLMDKLLTKEQKLKLQKDQIWFPTID